MAHKHSVYDTDKRFTIDPITRAIKNESSKKIALMQGDHNCERYTFEIPRYIEEHDMLLCNSVEVHYTNTDSNDRTKVSKDIYQVDDMQVCEDDESKLIFSWLVHENATQYGGSLTFRIKFMCTTDGVVDYKFHTARYTGISVTGGEDNSESVERSFSDILASWRDNFFGDWDENNAKNIGHIKNRPFYSIKEYINVFKTQKVAFTKGGNLDEMYADNIDITCYVKKGQKYLVEWDGVEYECTLTYDTGVNNLGSLKPNNYTELFEIWLLHDDNGLSDKANIIHTADTSETHVIGITLVEETLKILDAKFLPKNYAPTVAVNKVDGVTTVTFTDIEGEKTFIINDGTDGTTPTLAIVDGYWYINGENTGVKASGEDGQNGKDGKDGQNGKDGKDGATPTIEIINEYWHINGVNSGVKAKGEDGKDGQDGQDGSSATVDLTKYYTKEETDLSFQNALNSVNQMLNSYYTKGEVYNKQEIAELTQQALGELCTEEQVRAIVDEIINEALNGEV